MSNVNKVIEVKDILGFQYSHFNIKEVDEDG